MMKFSATLEGPFVGTAEELAAYVSGKLAALGFGPRFQANERLVRFYAFEGLRSEEHTSELQSLMRISYAVFCSKKKKQ